jgi:unsaturated rhamnogalacturonyl hydrolase
MSEPVIVNDPKGVGAFIKCAVEMEMVPQLSFGRGKTVLLDNFFNNETREADGRSIRHHYTWEDRTHGGYELLGSVFQQHGARIATLPGAPTAQSLKGASVYLIVDPDTEKESKSPNFIGPRHISAITAWVRAGGTLVLLGNDSANAEFVHFNMLANVFGVHFNEDKKNPVQGNEFEQGAIAVAPGHPVFQTAQKLYIKEFASLTVKAPAKPLLQHRGDIVMAVAPYGKGRVVTIGDPWLYNEYTDGRKLPASFQNFAAANDLVRWLLKPGAETKTAQKN